MASESRRNPSAMQQYFFDLNNGSFTQDEEGRAFVDLEAAVDHARTEARAMICAGVKEDGVINLHYFIRVGGEDDQALATIHFGNAVSITGLQRR